MNRMSITLVTLATETTGPLEHAPWNRPLPTDWDRHISPKHPAAYLPAWPPAAAFSGTSYGVSRYCAATYSGRQGAYWAGHLSGHEFRSAGGALTCALPHEIRMLAPSPRTAALAQQRLLRAAAAHVKGSSITL